MKINMVPLDSNKHKSLKINVDRNYAHIEKQHMVPLVAAEFLPSSTNFPIVFVKQQETGKFKSIGLLGLTNDENLLFSNGEVRTNYIPLNIRRYPFAAGGNAENEESMVLCIDENSTLLSENNGFNIFDNNGEPSKETEHVTHLLTDLIAKEKATDHFIEFLVEHDLLQAAEVSVKLGNEGDKKINGLYKVNEEELNELDDDVVLTLYKRKYFAAIYSHLASLSQFNRLLQLKAKFEPK